MRSFFCLLLVCVVFKLSAQDQKGEIMKVVHRVFEAMRTSDSLMLKDAFVENPATYTVFKNKAGETQFRTDDFQRFIDAVGQPKTDVWNEPIWNEKVEIDGPLAQVWVDYAFYLNDQFSHCGVDAFHMIEKDGQWKIFHLVDTRRRADCEVPEEVRKKYEGG